MPKDATGKNRKWSRHKDKIETNLTEEDLLKAMKKVSIPGMYKYRRVFISRFVQRKRIRIEKTSMRTTKKMMKKRSKNLDHKEDCRQVILTKKMLMPL